METCKCPDPELCKRLNMHVIGRLWEIWNGVNIDPNKAEAYRNLWEKQANLKKEVQPSTATSKSGCGCKS